MKKILIALILGLFLASIMSCEKEVIVEPEPKEVVLKPILTLNITPEGVILIGDSVTIVCSTKYAVRTENNFGFSTTNTNWSHKLEITKTVDLEVIAFNKLDVQDVEKKTVEAREPNRVDTLCSTEMTPWQIKEGSYIKNDSVIYFNYTQETLDNEESYYPNGRYEIHRYGELVGNGDWSFVGSDSMNVSNIIMRYEMTNTTLIWYGKAQVITDKVTEYPSKVVLTREDKLE